MSYLTSPEALPVIFAGLMGFSILAYVVLDGYDLGVGILMGRASRAEADIMVGAIGPFWDANETWLVLGIGLLLVAFPTAHGMILTALYLPALAMLIGLILRGVAFEFRVKAHPVHQRLWDRVFTAGSLMTALSQGYMLGAYIMGFDPGLAALAFSLLTAVCLAAGYAFIGATWLILKTEGDLQKRAVAWAKAAMILSIVGMAAVSLATPLVSPRIFERWFRLPELILLAPIPLITAALFAGLWIFLNRMPRADHSLDAVPFVMASALFVLGFFGLAYSFYPYVVPEKLTVWQAAAAPESLVIILIGALIVVPVIAGYSVLAYVIFRGKATALRYD